MFKQIKIEGLTAEEIKRSALLLDAFSSGISGGFETRLWSAIMKADTENLERLSKGFPGHVFVYLMEYNGSLLDRKTAIPENEIYNAMDLQYFPNFK